MLILPFLQAKLSRTIDDFLNITAQCAPSILISKPKFHFLVHLPLYIRRFGPAILFSSERYESFNHIFRLSCIHSNRQAPSRDSCNAFAQQDIIKHIATGGNWYDNAVGKWVKGGSEVVQYLVEHQVQARLLGIIDQNSDPCEYIFQFASSTYIISHHIFSIKHMVNLRWQPIKMAGKL